MKQRTKAILILMLTLITCQYLKAQTLILHHTNGTTTDIDLYTMPQVKFQNDKVLITSTVLDM